METKKKASKTTVTTVQTPENPDLLRPHRPDEVVKPSKITRGPDQQWTAAKSNDPNTQPGGQSRSSQDGGQKTEVASSSQETRDGSADAKASEPADKPARSRKSKEPEVRFNRAKRGSDVTALSVTYPCSHTRDVAPVTTSDGEFIFRVPEQCPECNDTYLWFRTDGDALKPSDPVSL